MKPYSTTEKEILTRLQRGIEITSQPFAPGELKVLQKAQADGLLRRFGGIFDARRLGYGSILCALDVPPEQLEQKAAVIAGHPGVTHCYERRPLHSSQSYPVLWFTLAMLHDEFEDGLNKLNSELGTENSELLQLPAVKRFKVDVVFDLQASARDETLPGRPVKVPCDEPFRIFSEEEKQLVRAIDQQLPLVDQPFAALAAQLGRSEEAVLCALRGWKEQGVLRRVGAVLYHREAGFKANAMCVWPVGGDVAAAGHRLAARPEVTHCYQRPRLDAFPFDLYAMIHTRSWEQIDVLFRDLSAGCGLTGGELFVSGREFKKSSMKYFREE